MEHPELKDFVEESYLAGSLEEIPGRLKEGSQSGGKESGKDGRKEGSGEGADIDS
jgi:hypothetical protein